MNGLTPREIAIGVACALAATGVQQIPGLTIQSDECAAATVSLSACEATLLRDQASKGKAWCMYRACATGGDERECEIPAP